MSVVFSSCDQSVEGSMEDNPTHLHDNQHQKVDDNINNSSNNNNMWNKQENKVHYNSIYIFNQPVSSSSSSSSSSLSPLPISSPPSSSKSTSSPLSLSIYETTVLFIKVISSSSYLVSYHVIYIYIV